MKWSWKIGTLAGIEVRVHATFLLLITWVGWGNYTTQGSMQAALAGVTFIALLFGIVVLHELGHALTARRFGVATRDITLLPIGGVARLERMPDNPRHELAVAVAGPGVNVVLAAGLATVGLLAGMDIRPAATTDNLVAQLLWINVGLATFNMLPAFPLDGGRALRALLAMRMPDVRATEVAARLGQALAVVLGIAGLFGNVVLLLIAVFIWMGARAETTAAHLKDAMSGLTAGQAAIRELHVLSVNDRVSTAVEYALHGFQRDFPVLEHGQVAGVLSHRALLSALSEEGRDSPVSTLMEPDPAMVPPTMGLSKALEALETAPCRCLLVVDSRGQLAGMLTVDAVGELIAVREAVRRREAPFVPAMARGAATRR
ncbi:MAG: site-2 protease family protein [Nannocystales bacterium]